MLKISKLIFIILVTIQSSSLLANKIINTSSGVVSGFEKDQVINWHDIPYAEPPIGELRWRAPKLIYNSKENIFPKEGNFCIQEPYERGGAPGDEDVSGTEDCLYLDIQAPIATKNSKLPVMFWIHGGGNTSGLKDSYNFSKLVKKEKVIVVSINYRLGAFGWFTHPAIQEFQSGLDKSSNFGTLDIIAALKWTQENIAKFGGDPNNVTIFGESAGGHNVLSLLVSKEAKGLFHKAISQSGYTTTYSIQEAYKPKTASNTSEASSSKIFSSLIKSIEYSVPENEIKIEEQRNILKDIDPYVFFLLYQKENIRSIPLITEDGITMPFEGMKAALGNPEHLNIVPTIAGSNKDEVKLWLAAADYFVKLDKSFFGNMIGVPKPILRDKQAYQAFNYFRATAWQLRGVIQPLSSMYEAGNKDVYAYRFDWDDHRRFIVGDFKKLIGAAHATEIPLLAGNSKLVGGYPLSDLIYPPSFSKFYLSRNMMKFWANFAKFGSPGSSTNNVVWEIYNPTNHQYMILDKKKNLQMSQDFLSFEVLSQDLFKDMRVTNLEKCVILLQMFTFVGDDLYDDYIDNYPGTCDRKKAERFLKDNASFIEY